MNRVCLAFAVATGVIASVSSAQVSPAIKPAPAGRSPVLWGLMNEYLEAVLERSPGTGLQFGDERFNDRLFDASPQAKEAWDRRVDAFLARLQTMDRSGFSEQDRTDADLLQYSWRLAVQGRRFHAEQLAVSAIDGPQFSLPQMAITLPFRTARHYDDYSKRLEAIPVHLDQVTQQLRLGIKAGRTQPRFIAAKSVSVARALVDGPGTADPRSSPFYKPFAGADQTPAAQRAAAAIQGGVMPAFRKFADFLETEYVPACRESPAAADGADGREGYDFRLRDETTTALSSDDIHALGLSEVARIKSEMMTVIAATDFPERGSLKGDELFAAFVRYLRTEPRFYHDSPESLVAHYRQICKRIDAELPELFGTLPRNSYGVKEIPRFAAPTSPTAYYYPGSMKSGVAGLFMANTYRLDQRPKYEAIALTLHESVPGHHLQIALSQELEGVHPLRTLGGYTAFVEGWALYAERLGLEVGDEDSARGLYADPYDDFGRLNMEMWRAMRLVVDTGIHSMGWSRQRAIDFMLANSALAALNIENEVDRYIGWPGQACAYKIGELKIRELRKRAEESLGSAFDRRAFHDALLGAGAVPLPVLESRIDRWIEGTRTGERTGG